MKQLKSRLSGDNATTFPYFDALLKTEKGSKELNSVGLVICHPIAAPVAHANE
jgi:hypothetical protein